MTLTLEKIKEIMPLLTWSTQKNGISASVFSTANKLQIVFYYDFKPDKFSIYLAPATVQTNLNLQQIIVYYKKNIKLPNFK